MKKKGLFLLRFKKLAILAFTVTLPVSILFGCSNRNSGNTISDSSAEISESTTSVSSEEQTFANTNTSADKTQSAPNSSIQENDAYIYISADNCIQRYEKSDLTNSYLVYQCDTDHSLFGYCLYGDNVYILTSGNDSNGTVQLLLVNDPQVEPSVQLDFSNSNEYYSQVQVYNDTLYLSGSNEFKAYNLNTNGTIGTENTDYSVIEQTVMSSDDIMPISSYFVQTNYYDIPYCMNIYGKIYLTNYDNQLLEADPDDQNSLMHPSVLNDQIPGQISGMTNKYLISMESNYDEDNGNAVSISFYTIDLQTGESNTFYTVDTTSTTVNILGVAENGIYLGTAANNIASDTTQSKTDYQVSYISYDGTTDTNLFSFTPETSINPFLNDLHTYGFLSDGFYYVRSQNYKDLAFMRTYDNITQEKQIGQTPFYDSGLEAAGITLQETNYSVYVDDDPSKTKLINILTSIPVFDSSITNADTINQIFSSAANDLETSGVSQVKEDYEYYIEANTDDEDGYYGGFPYESDYTFSQITYQDDRYINLGISQYMYTGGAHGGTIDEYYLIDKETGTQLSLDDILQTSKQDFSGLVVSALQEKVSADPDMYFEDAVSSTQSYYSSNDYDYNFYLTPDGVAVEFGQYEVAPYAAGISNVVIPYSDLSLKINLKAMNQ